MLSSMISIAGEGGSVLTAPFEFKTSVPLRGRKWDFNSDVNRRFKPSGYHGYLTEGTEVAENVGEGTRFRFTVIAPHNIFIKKCDVLDVINHGTGEIERAHFIICLTGIFASKKNNGESHKHLQ